ncbi:hypothetical protein [Bradyrhizobium sp.]|jgi:hypothetical protein|uniref:hypothetical protein n=1 Tax=Bradyrhizobium sp. TaxID=376 RepID=UPI003D0B1DE2
MIAIALIGIAAGCASALMFASMISGVLISLLLIYLAPLPLMVAALGWGPLSATIGGITAATVLGAIFGLPFCIVFAVTVALPAWWLGHLVLLGRPIAGGVSSGNGAEPVAPILEWYPIGRILLWLSGFAALNTMAGLLAFGTDVAAVSGALRESLLLFLGQRDTAAPPEIDQLVNMLVTIAPSLGAISVMMMLTFNLWLAAKITATSGRLHRPWPDLKSAALPPLTLPTLCAAIAFCFAGGLLAILAQIITAVLMMAYALTGFAVLHTLTLALKSRALWLGCTYAIVVLFVWPVVAMVVLGIADAIFGFRQRYLQGRPPPLPTS